MLELLHGAGHTDFRDARGPMGFTQRQAAGKFTRQEAESFIDGLQNTGGDTRPAFADRGTEPTPEQRALRRVAAEQLAAELRRRGWTVTRGPTSAP